MKGKTEMKNVQGFDPRIHPINLDAEKAVLGTFFLDERVTAAARTMLTPDDFYDPRHQEIYRLIVEVLDSGSGVDPMILANEFERRGKLEKVGGFSYITGLEQAVISPDNVTYHAEIVLNKANLRRIISGAHAVQEGVFKDENLGMALGNLANLVDEIAQRSSRLRTMDSEELATEMWGEIEHESQADMGDDAVKSHLRALDDIIHGFKPGELTIIAARPSVGKSALAVQIAVKSGQIEVRTLLATLEMSWRMVMDRVVAAGISVNADRFRKRQYDPQMLSKCAEFLEDFKTKFFHIFDDFNTNNQSLRAALISIGHRFSPVKMLVVDYMQLMNDGVTSRRGANRQEIVSSISRGLKGIARDFNIPVIALSQLNRSSEQRNAKEAQPRLSDLRESGSIEQDADVVIFMHRPKDAFPGNMEKIEINVAKNRNGPIGIREILFDKPHQTFYDTPQTYETRGGENCEPPHQYRD